MGVARMRLPCLPILLVAAAFVSCARDVKITNSNRESPAARVASRDRCVNLNTATVEELIALPGIGEAIGRRIVEYRERHGPFRRPEEVIIIEGLSERKYRPLVGLICVE